MFSCTLVLQMALFLRACFGGEEDEEGNWHVDRGLGGRGGGGAALLLPRESASLAEGWTRDGD
eukprot:COSAG02_NODE_301_length_25237_cov_19.918490_8_plen_63_part_00